MGWNHRSAEGKEEMTAPELKTVTVNRNLLERVLKQAFHLGQTYWQQADSESWSQQKKSDATFAKFNALVDETCALLAEKTKPVKPDFCDTHCTWADHHPDCIRSKT
jgi:hypothetical protein